MFVVNRPVEKSLYSRVHFEGTAKGAIGEKLRITPRILIDELNVWRQRSWGGANLGGKTNNLLRLSIGYVE